jgi:hypothetical protein
MLTETFEVKKNIRKLFVLQMKIKADKICKRLCMENGRKCSDEYI